MKTNPLVPRIAASFLLACGALSAYAQGPGGPGGPGGGVMGRPPNGGPAGGDSDPLTTLVHSLNLTNAQKAQIQPMLDASSAQIKAIREEASTKTETVVQSTETQMKPLLTPYQQQVLASLEKNREAMKAGPRGMPMRPGT